MAAILETVNEAPASLVGCPPGGTTSRRWRNAAVIWRPGRRAYAHLCICSDIGDQYSRDIWMAAAAPVPGMGRHCDPFHTSECRDRAVQIHASCTLLASI